MILLGLGSNIGDRENNILRAIREIESTGNITIKRYSSLYSSEPVGPQDQPEFLNAVIEIDTNLSPNELLTYCLNIERLMGRIRNERWGPRNIDIDLLTYNDIVINSDELCLPHPYFHERNFVLLPLSEFAGDEPIYNGRTAVELIRDNPSRKSVFLYKELKLKEN